MDLGAWPKSPCHISSNTHSQPVLVFSSSGKSVLGQPFCGSYTLRFQEYWFDREHGGYPNVYQGWMWVLVFQIVTVALAVLTIVREKVKEHPLPFLGVISTSAVTLTLACYQLFRHSASGRGIAYLTVSIDTGFVLALSSLALWLCMHACMLFKGFNDSHFHRRHNF